VETGNCPMSWHNPFSVNEPYNCCLHYYQHFIFPRGDYR